MGLIFFQGTFLFLRAFLTRFLNVAFVLKATKCFVALTGSKKSEKSNIISFSSAYTVLALSVSTSNNGNSAYI
jgi:hypothetical protein